MTDATMRLLTQQVWASVLRWAGSSFSVHEVVLAQSQLGAMQKEIRSPPIEMGPLVCMAHTQ